MKKKEISQKVTEGIVRGIKQDFIDVLNLQIEKNRREINRLAEEQRILKAKRQRLTQLIRIVKDGEEAGLDEGLRKRDRIGLNIGEKS